MGLWCVVKHYTRVLRAAVPISDIEGDRDDDGLGSEHALYILHELAAQIPADTRASE